MSVSLNSSPAMEQRVAENEVEQIKLLAAVNDEHEGVIVELSEPMNSEVFALMLKASIAHWRNQGKRGIWIKVPIELVNLVEAAVKQGFLYHHAEPNYLMLIYWIPEGTHTLPANASHRVGIGAFVMNEKREVCCGCSSIILTFCCELGAYYGKFHLDACSHVSTVIAQRSLTLDNFMPIEY